MVRVTRDLVITRVAGGTMVSRVAVIIGKLDMVC